MFSQKSETDRNILEKEVTHEIAMDEVCCVAGVVEVTTARIVLSVGSVKMRSDRTLELDGRSIGDGDVEVDAAAM